ncbi:MAG: hypothetical protein AAGD96_24115 [Chloroflexota bacterium]
MQPVQKPKWLKQFVLILIAVGVFDLTIQAFMHMVLAYAKIVSILGSPIVTQDSRPGLIVEENLWGDYSRSLIIISFGIFFLLSIKLYDVVLKKSESAEIVDYFSNLITLASLLSVPVWMRNLLFYPLKLVVLLILIGSILLPTNLKSS